MSNYFKYFPRYLVIMMLKIYQKIFSFDHGLLKIFKPYGHCHFRPTCSDYAIAAVEKYGVMRGGAKALWRVTRCNPWNKGGWDPVK